jgi:hypothetical protein
VHVKTRVACVRSKSRSRCSSACWMKSLGVRGGKRSGARAAASRLHLRTNAKRDPLTFDVTGGAAHEVKGYDALMRLHEANPSMLLGDKGYDSDDIRRDLIDRGIEPVIPPRSNRRNANQI